MDKNIEGALFVSRLLLRSRTLPDGFGSLFKLLHHGVKKSIREEDEHASWC